MKLLRKFIHTLILRYIERNGGAFHTQPYGVQGRYVVALADAEYHELRGDESWRHAPPRIVYPAAIPRDGGDWIFTEATG